MRTCSLFMVLTEVPKEVRKGTTFFQENNYKQC